MKIKIKTLTPIWTGGVDRNDKLRLTGIKGSIRWWYEVLIRGLDYYACDPIADDNCKLDPKKIDRNLSLLPQIKSMICPVCYLFGCTGWSGKFNLRIKECRNDNVVEIIRGQIKANNHFVLEFIQRKKIEQAEEILLKMTLKLIIDYGAIGGKTALKPSEKDFKNLVNYGGGRHLDYGIIDRLKDANGEDLSGIPSDKIYDGEKKTALDDYLSDFDKSANKNNPEWPDLKYFWFVDGAHIKRDEHNAIVNRDDKGSYQNPNELQKFLGGYIPRENVGPKDENASKKIFSFHGQESGISRCFGYAKKGDLDKVINLIEDKSNKGYLKGEEIKRGAEVLKNEL
ncbi:MAG: type III-B CRISPR module RAMP protein Cmr1 [bacterium]|nr:type III-B CRISPR module RAMP protein Cmr1 [bacterium]